MSVAVMRLHHRIGPVASAIGAITRSRNTLMAQECAESYRTARCGTDLGSDPRLGSWRDSGLAGLDEEGHRYLVVQLDLAGVVRQLTDLPRPLTELSTVTAGEAIGP